MSDISVSEIQLSYPRGKHIKKILNLLKKGKNRVMGEKAELDISQEKCLAEEIQN